jgi:hypothetical protein
MTRHRIIGVKSDVAAIILLFYFYGFALIPHILTNFTPVTDFSKYRTFQWVAVKGSTHPDQIVDAEIRRSIDAQLLAKGYTKSETESSDMYVAYEVSVESERPWNPFGWDTISTATSSGVQVVTLEVYLYDPVRGQLIWRREANKTPKLTNSQEVNQKNLDTIMAKLFISLPPT